MALVYVDGFDAGDWRNRYTTTDTEGVNIGTVATTRTGSGLSWRAGTNSGVNTGIMRPIPTSTFVTLGVAMRVGSAPFSSAYNSRLLAIGNTNGPQVGLLLRNSGTHTVCLGSQSTALFTVPAPIGSWYYFELRVSSHNLNGTAEARINGQVVGTYSGNTRASGTLATLDRIYIGSAVADNGDLDDALWDDVYVTAGATAADAEFLGEIRVKSLKVNGAGASTGLTPVGSANNWENVDEFPPSGTDYNSSSVSGTKDTYTTENLALSPGDKIIGVQANAVVSTVEAGTASAKLVFRSGSTEYTSAPLNVSSSPLTISSIYPKNPNTASDWSEATVNDTEIGIEVG